MKNELHNTLGIMAFWLATLAGLHAQAQQQYNPSLADSLGADEYGMKSYVLVILKTGPNKTTDEAVLDSLFRGHMRNMDQLAETGKLVVAGPLQKNDRQYRGIFVFNVATIAEGKQLLETDPAVKAGIFDAELYGWYGSAALPLYLPYHEKVQKKAVVE